MNPPAIEKAEGRDTGEIEDLLRASGLPVEGVQAHIRDFFITREGPAITGVIGLEQYGEDGLLRSLAVREPDRSKGIGSRLCLRLIDEARTRGIRRLVLLTTTAGEYFSVRGFRIIDRSSIAGGLRDSAEFRGACPASATCMERLL